MAGTQRPVSDLPRQARAESVVRDGDAGFDDGDSPSPVRLRANHMDSKVRCSDRGVARQQVRGEAKDALNDRERDFREEMYPRKMFEGISEWPDEPPVEADDDDWFDKAMDEEFERERWELWDLVEAGHLSCYDDEDYFPRRPNLGDLGYVYPDGHCQ
jgi:hypothetical protein